jgi:hypothetical protein
MALADTGKAIGAVTKLLGEHLLNRTKLSTDAGRPEGNTSGPRFNLFLYEAQFDPGLKNIPLDEGQPPPLWLVLKYLLTAFDKDGNSDTAQAHEHLGEGIRALKESSFLRLMPLTASDIRKALNDNPQVLKLTFDNIPADLLSKLMQGPDEKYRFSIGFEVRPVMIATGEPSTYSLLVGVDQTAGKMIGEEGIKIPVIPSMGPVITQISPSKFEAGSILTIFGNDLNLSNLSLCIDQVELAVTSQQPGKLQCAVNGNVGSGNIISAGSRSITVIHTLPTGRQRSSNILVGDLLPTLTAAAANAVTHVTPGDMTTDVSGNIVMTGTLLGKEKDDIFVALYRDGNIIRMFDEFKPPFDQSTLTLAIPPSNPIHPGKYRIILRVNGQQAKNSPEVDLS